MRFEQSWWFFHFEEDQNLSIRWSHQIHAPVQEQPKTLQIKKEKYGKKKERVPTF